MGGSVSVLCSVILMVVTGQGKKLFFSLLLLLLIGLKLLPEGSMPKSFMIALVLARRLKLAIDSREGSGQLITCSDVLVTLCRPFLSATVQLADHAGMA